ncbi:hypothetical protein O0L34_g10824 [Tuta absoluta]|nr:hypothetical protein O0L34_g10824 [Tuta absoluta]
MANKRLSMKQKILVIVNVILVWPSQCQRDFSIEFPDEYGFSIETRRDDHFNFIYEGIKMKDYCPKMPYCPEGSHVLCLYFMAHKVENPMCMNYRGIPMVQEMRENILSYVNEIRGKVARGVETRGRKNDFKGVPMPRGYGLFKLKWDRELATIAQVMVNMCNMKVQYCKATYNFPNPWAVGAFIKYSIPDWQPIDHMGKRFRSKGFDREKISYCLRQCFMNFYSQKFYVAEDYLEGKGIEDRMKYRRIPMAYLALINDDITHIGCGMSAFTAPEPRSKKMSASGKNGTDFATLNIIWLICNVNASPREGKPIYRTDKPSVEELCKGDKACAKRYDSKCGCPPDIAEDDRCLCTEPKVYPPPPPKCGVDTNCKPAVVLVPIIQVEDAPPKKISRHGLPDNTTLIADLESYTPEEEENQYASFGENEANRFLPQRRNPLTSAAKNNEPSIFSKEPKLHNAVYKDVASRSDISKKKQALKEYLNKRRKEPRHSAAKHYSYEIDDDPRTKPNSVELKLGQNIDTSMMYTNISLINPQISTHLKSRYYDYDINHDATHKHNKNNAIKKSDRKLLSLLDSLEQEVKHVDFDGSQKEIFDAKLKKIYGTVLNNPEYPASNRDFNNQDDTSGFLENENSKLEEDEQTDINKLGNSYLHDVNKIKKASKYSNFKEKSSSNYKFRHDKMPEFNKYIKIEDPKYTDIDKNLEITEDIVADKHPDGSDEVMQSLYARPVPRDQSSLRPTMKQTNYVYRNTLNNIKTPRIELRDYQELRDSDYSLSKGSNYRVKDDVKVLPYHLQYGNERHDKYSFLNNYNAPRHKVIDKNVKSEYYDKNDFDGIHDKTSRYKDEIMKGFMTWRKENALEPQKIPTLRGKDDLFKENIHWEVVEINTRGIIIL